MKKLLIDGTTRKISKDKIVVGYLQENKIEKLEFEIPEEYKNYGRKACFKAQDKTFAKIFDDITSDTLTLTRDMTQYDELEMSIAFFKTENEDEIVARTSILKIYIENAIICDDDVKPDDPKVIILDNLITRVTQLDKTITKNEEIREANENTRQQNETTREENEVKRVNSEANREKAEESRKNDELKRVSNENTRKSNEEKRKTAENKRVSNENARQEYINNLKSQVDNGDFDGADFNYKWDGTKLGVKNSKETTYQYVELKGQKGEKGEKGDTVTYKAGTNIEITEDNTINYVGSGETGDVSSDTINSIMVVDELPETEVEGVLYLVKEASEPVVLNLYPSQVENTETNGFTVTFKEQKVIVDGSNDSSSVWGWTNRFNMNLEANKTYYLQFTNLSGSFDDSKRISQSDGIVNAVMLTGYDSSGGSTNLINSVERTASEIYEKYTFTPTTTYSEYALSMQVKKLNVFTNWTCSIVIAEEIDDGNLYDYLTASILNNAKVTDTTIVSGSNQNKITYLQVEPNTTYTISKTVNEHFGVGLSTEEPVIGTVFNTYSNNATLSEVTITTGANDNYLAIYYWTSYDTGTEEEIRSSIVVTKV